MTGLHGEAAPNTLVRVCRQLDRWPIPVLAVLLGGLFFLTVLPNYNWGPADGDLAEYLNNPVRVLHGELPYRDFWLLFPPGEVYLPALLYRLLGLNINVLLIFGLAINAAVGVASFLLARSFLPSNSLALVPAFLVFYGGTPRWSPCYMYPQTYLLCVLAAACFLVAWLRERHRSNLIITGLLAGFGMTFRLDLTLTALAAMALAIVADNLRYRRGARATLGALIILCTASIGVPAITVVALHRIRYEMLGAIGPAALSHGTSMPLPWFSDLSHCWGFAFRGLRRMLAEGSPVSLLVDGTHFLNVLATHLLPLALLVAMLWWVGQRERKLHDWGIIVLFAAWSALALPKFAVRAGMGNLLHGATPLFFLLAWLLWQLTQILRNEGDRTTRIVHAALLVLMAALLAAVPVVIAQNARALLRPRYAVTTTHGRLVYPTPEAAAEAQALITFILANSSAGEYIFVTSWFAPPLYALTDRRNPTYYDSLIDPIARPDVDKQERICRDLLAHDTRAIVHSTDWSFDDRTELNFVRACPLVQRCIDEHFVSVQTVGPYRLYLPRSPTID